MKVMEEELENYVEYEIIPDGKNKSTGSRNAGRRTGRRLGGYERQGRIKNEIYSKF